LSFILPQPILIAIWAEIGAFFSHVTIRMDLPPGAEIETEMVPEIPGHVQWHFGMTFGDLVNPLVEVEHWHETQMLRHIDPLYYSIVKWIYPLSLKVTSDKPHGLIIRNKDTTTQTVEATLWFVDADRGPARKIELMFKGLMNSLIEKAKE